MAPSQRRLEQAREEGRVARSRDLSGAVATFACVAALIVAGAGISERAMGWMATAFASAAGTAATTRDDAMLLKSLNEALGDALLAVSPVLAAGMVAGILGSVGLGGLVLSGKALGPDFTRLSPLKGFGRMFSLAGLAELGKALLKVLVLGGVAGLLVWHGIEGWLSLVLPAPSQALAALGGILSDYALVLAGALFVIAAADVPLQWWNHHKNLRMTFEEAKQENKETEGDPHVKGRIRQLQRDRARSRMMQAVPTADVVVTNPSHYAVALKYDDARMSAPRVVAKGADMVAARIRELAGQHGVTVLESPKLARALYRHAEVDQEVPVALYRAVAQVLAYVYQVRDHVAGPPPELKPIEVPAGWDPLDEAPLGRGGRA
ncbi:MAG: flagellar biosynthesis protein FlhB [Pigmentiphaga sp.]|uniref:flagellar biosynthesis protein FlhB n=1 Tax=Pigmentiphaga sp. TaxID=1977564 RepID=UPI0029B51472|nr:flagellar biosynthesis protein FlhB [Pigmentiphaga sp.]MDX3904121.1 flagellar biosynthesis protein FlhB [Pigmentiphaga sp.]